MPKLSLEQSTRLYEELIGIASLVILAVVLGFFSQLWTLTFLLAFGFYIARNLFYFWRFVNLIRSQQTRPISSPFGIWGEIYEAYFEKLSQDKRYIKRLRSETRQVQQAMDLLPDMHISLTRKFRIEWVNQSAERLLGLHPRDVGKKITNILRQPEMLDYLDDGDYQDSVEFYASAESSRRLSAQIVPYFERHYLLIIRDITDAHNLSTIRRDFVANASHELRTPLTVLNGYLELMLDDNTIPEVWQAPLKQMHAQSLRMQNILIDLLTLSSIESNNLNVSAGPINISTMLEKLEQDALLLSEGQHKITFKLETDLGLMGMREPLRSVFTNLVSNAIRYTPNGGQIKVRWYQTDQALIFEVKDSGIGIAREHIPRLTERFYRVDTARSRSTGGTGLGLAIVKHILERHRAQLIVESRLQVGSTFRCEFPSSLALPADEFNPE